MKRIQPCRLFGVVMVFFVLQSLGFAYGETINPQTDIEYLGAFRLPSDTTGSQNGWSYGLEGMTYNPNGDDNGINDGYPGSLYAIGFSNESYVAEISIPVPVKTKELNQLNRSTTLQNFKDINQGKYICDYIETEIAYLPKQGAQTTEKIYISWNNWYNVSDSDVDRYGWCETNLSAPNTQGPWNLGNPNEVHVGDVGNYLIEIPKYWADLHTPGKLLVAGKYRQGASADGGSRYGGGPAMHAFGPWNQGNPPNPETTIDQITLLSYTGGHVWKCPSTGDVAKVKDKWEGGAWITDGSKSAVVLIGRKGIGEDYYGVSPNGCDGKGYHNLGGYKPYMLFFDTDDLAAVVHGTKKPYEPQPYTTLDCGPYAFRSFDLCNAGYSSAAYDRVNQLLYVAEPFVDGSYHDKAVIHVFKIKANTFPTSSAPAPPNGVKAIVK